MDGCASAENSRPFTLERGSAASRRVPLRDVIGGPGRFHAKRESSRGTVSFAANPFHAGPFLALVRGSSIPRSARHM